MSNVAEIMIREPLFTIGPRANVGQASALIRDSGVSHLLVTEAETLLGVVCVCDLEQVPAHEPVERCMTRHPLCLEPDSSSAEAVALMRGERVSLLPVVDRGVLVGVVARSDLRALGLDVDGLGADAECAACGSRRHVRALEPNQLVGFCLDCRHSSRPPAPDDEAAEELGSAG